MYCVTRFRCKQQQLVKSNHDRNSDFRLSHLISWLHLRSCRVAVEIVRHDVTFLSMTGTVCRHLLSTSLPAHMRSISTKRQIVSFLNLLATKSPRVNHLTKITCITALG